MTILNNILQYLIIALPALLVTGPFLSDLAVSIIGLIVLFLIINKKIYYLFDNKYFKLYIFFCIYLIFGSILSSDTNFSLKSSIVYFRFGFLVIGTIYILDNFGDTFYKKFNLFLLITFFTVCIDGYIQYFFGYNILGLDQPQKYRISGFFGSEMILGSYLSKLFPLTLIAFIMIQEKKKYFIYKLFLFIIFTLIIMIMSGERSALFLNLLFICIFINFTNYINFRFKIYFLLTIVFVMTSLIFINPKIKDRLVDQTLSSFQGHFSVGGEFVKTYSYLILEEKKNPNFDVEKWKKNNTNLDPMAIEAVEWYIQDKRYPSVEINISKKIKDKFNFLIQKKAYEELAYYASYQFRDKNISKEDKDNIYLLANTKVQEIFNDKLKNKNKFIFFSHDTHSHFMTAYNMFLDKKILGHGVKMFRKLCSDEKYIYDIWSCTTHPHNSYLQLLSETGLIGFLFVFSIFILALCYFLKIIYKKIIN